MKKLKVSAVSFLNTKPFLRGFQMAKLSRYFDLAIDIPSVCGTKLLNKEADIALAPVAVLPQLESYHLVSDYCIGCDGEVQTVGIYSHVPLHKVQAIIPDPQSMTSNILANLLLKKFWKLDISFVDQNEIQKDVASYAFVKIGDSLFKENRKYAHYYDLGKAWQTYTSMPFVFATWTAIKPVSDEIESLLNHAFSLGIASIPEIAAEEQPLYHERFDVEAYLSTCISYSFDMGKKKALKTFLQQVHPYLSAKQSL